MEKSENIDLTNVLKIALKERNNPKDLKAMIIGEVVQLNPIKIGIWENKVFLEENIELYISEWFKFRCNIDNTTSLSADIPQALENAKNITETHSYNGASCQMPNAITYLSTAISKINTELLQLRCNLKLKDYVLIGSLEQTDKYILIDKIENIEE